MSQRKSTSQIDKMPHKPIDEEGYITCCNKLVYAGGIGPVWCFKCHTQHYAYWPEREKNEKTIPVFV